VLLRALDVLFSSARRRNVRRTSATATGGFFVHLPRSERQTARDMRAPELIAISVQKDRVQGAGRS
jgi:hypothetical protein